jgi:regulator of protease activity HflC (stomatin/prohibitin superfamily)
VRVKRIDLPPEVSSAVLRSVNSERQILARQFRATGRERALEIRGDADRQVVVVAADAYKKAEETAATAMRSRRRSTRARSTRIRSSTGFTAASTRT